MSVKTTVQCDRCRQVWPMERFKGERRVRAGVQWLIGVDTSRDFQPLAEECDLCEPCYAGLFDAVQRYLEPVQAAKAEPAEERR